MDTRLPGRCWLQHHLLSNPEPCRALCQEECCHCLYNDLDLEAAFLERLRGSRGQVQALQQAVAGKQQALARLASENAQLEKKLAYLNYLRPRLEAKQADLQDARRRLASLGKEVQDCQAARDQQLALNLKQELEDLQCAIQRLSNSKAIECQSSAIADKRLQEIADQSQQEAQAYREDREKLRLQLDRLREEYEEALAKNAGLKDRCKALAEDGCEKKGQLADLRRQAEEAGKQLKGVQGAIAKVDKATEALRRE
jgi:chromosome segregation ATPase